MKKFLKLFITIIYSFAFALNDNCASNEKNGNNVFTQSVRRKSSYSYGDNPIEYLLSFDNAELFNDANVTTYKARKEVEENEKGYKFCEYDITYIKFIDLMFIDFNYLDCDGNILFLGNSYAYPFENENGERDIMLDFYSQTVFYSTFYGKRDRNTPNKKMLRPIDFPPPVFEYDYDLISISYCVSTFDDALGLSYSFVVIPDILTLGPLPYLFYQWKLELTSHDFLINNDLNSTNPLPSGYINGQSLFDYHFDQWAFGIGTSEHPATISKAGCGCIAVYNLLYDSIRPNGVTPHLPSIIALTQLCNADLFGGVFGTNSFPDFAINQVIYILESVYEQDIKPVLESLIIPLSVIIVGTYVGVSGWLDLFFPGLTEAIAITIQTALITSIAAVSLFLNWFLAQQNNISSVISLVIYPHSCLTYTNLSSFEGAVSTKKQGFLASWNYANSDGTINFNDGLHIVYFNHDVLLNRFTFYNYYSDSSVALTNLSSIANAVEYGCDYNIGHASDLFVGGFLIIQ